MNSSIDKTAVALPVLTAADQAVLTAGAAIWNTAAVAGLPPLHMADGPMGVASGRVDERDIAVLTPAPVALGASWDVGLVARIGAIVGSEAAKSGVDALLAPNLNLARSPLAGRAFEYFSEDPFLTGDLGRAWIEGLQSRGTGSIPKHLACNDSETDRHAVDVQVDEATLREVYLLPFEMALDARPAGFLMAYNRVNGSYCSEHALMMNEIIKQDWQFDGLLVSDWFGVQNGQAAITAGLDLEMPGPGRQMGHHVTTMVASGAVSAARLQEAAERVAATALRFAGKGQSAELDQETLLAGAAAGMVLLKNDAGILPLDPARHRKIALIGPNWAAPCYQGGTFAKIAVDPALPTPLQAVTQALAGRFDIRSAQGCLPEPVLPPMPVMPSDGQPGPGMLLRYYATQDFTAAPIASEIRNTNSLTWFARTQIAAVIDRKAGIVASGIFTPRTTGTHRLMIGGSGALRVRMNGVMVHQDDKAYAPADVMGRLKSGDADPISFDVTSLDPISIEIELRYDPAHVQGLWYGIETPDETEALMAEAETLAKGSDLVLLMLGETSDASVESKDRQHSALSDVQLRLLARVRQANPALVVMVNVGHALALDFAEDVAGLMLALYPGQAFGPALAQVLLGQREPGGRLSFTIAHQDADYPALGLTPGNGGKLAYTEGRQIGYRSFVTKGITPRYALGDGFGYGQITLNGAHLQGGNAVMTVENRAARPAKAVVQLYAKRLDGAEEAFVSLVGYASADVPAHGKQTIRLQPDLRPLRRWTQEGWQPSHQFALYAGLSLSQAMAQGPLGVLQP